MHGVYPQFFCSGLLEQAARHKLLRSTRLRGWDPANTLEHELVHDPSRPLEPKFAKQERQALEFKLSQSS